MTINVLRIEGAQIEAGRWNGPEMIETLNAADTIVFGTPTYMGGPAAQFKVFADATGGLKGPLGRTSPLGPAARSVSERTFTPSA